MSADRPVSASSHTRPESPRRPMPAGPLQPIPDANVRLSHAVAAAAHQQQQQSSPMPRPPSATHNRLAVSPRVHSPSPSSPSGSHASPPQPAYQPSLADVQHWLASHSPALLTDWCTTNAQPLLGGFLEAWMTMNAGALFAQESARVVAPLQSELADLRAQVADLKAQLADVHATVQAQLLNDLQRNTPSFVTSVPSSPAAPQPPQQPPPQQQPQPSTNGVASAVPTPSPSNLGFGSARKGSAGPGGRSIIVPGVSEDGVEAPADPRQVMRARMSSKGPLTINGRMSARSSTGLPIPDSSAFAFVPGGARGPVAAAIASSAKTPGLGEEVVANLTSLELAQTKAASSRSSGSRASKGNGPIDIIVVEDLGVAQKIAHAALTRGHYKVEVAGSGEEALELFRKHLGMLKAVLMDIQLPGISGTETTEKMRRMEAEAGVPPVYIYGLTGNVSEEDLDKYKSVGMNGCILKGKLLADAVRQAMEESQNGVEFVNLCDKQASGSASARPPAPSPSHFQQAANPQLMAVQQQTAQPPVPFNGSVSSIRTEPMGVNTPRAPEPRKLMQNRYEGSGQVKPGIGLPNAQPAPVGPNMLLVEDVRVSQKVAVTALTRAGYKVVAADNGEAAVEKYKQHASTFRYIIMDINLPGISGIEATEQIRALEKAAGSGAHPVYIFGLTGNVDAESMRNYEAAGMNGCILKGKVLADAVKQAIEQADQGSFVNIS